MRLSSLVTAILRRFGVERTAPIGAIQDWAHIKRCAVVDTTYALSLFNK